MRIFALVFSFCIALLFQVSAQDVATNRIIIQLKENTNLNNFKNQTNALRNGFPQIKKIKYISKIENLAVVILEEPSLNIDELVEQFGHFEDVLFSSTDHKVELRNTPNDPLAGEQWNMELIKATEAWDVTTGGKNYFGDDIVVAVIDSGFEYLHEDLIDNVWTNQAEIPDDGIDNDNNGYVDDYYGLNVQTGTDDLILDDHGTQVLGILGGRGNNSKGISGVNWNIKIMLITGASFESEIVEAYAYAKAQRIKYNETNGIEGDFVVATNSSFGINKADADNFVFWCSEYDKMGEAGILSAVSTANINHDVDVVGDMPSTCPSPFVIAVTNVTSQDVISTGAAYGFNNIDLGAPGSGTTSTNLNNSYDVFGGTSAACPHVAGAIALMYSIDCEEFATSYRSDPSGTAAIVRNSILDNVDSNASLDGKTSTGGRLNIYNSILGLETICGSTNSGPLAINLIAPNPGEDIMRFHYTTNTTTPHQILVFDASGRLVIENQINVALFDDKSFYINVKDLSQGVYFVHFSNEGEEIVEKILVR